MRRTSIGTRWAGPLQTGVDTGATATSTIGHAAVTQVASLAGTASGATSIIIPANSDILAMSLHLVSAASAATSIQSQGISWRVGRVAGNDAYFATIKTSAIGVYPVGGNPINLPSVASAASWIGTAVTADTQVFVDCTALTSVSGGITHAGGRLYISYFQR